MFKVFLTSFIVCTLINGIASSETEKVEENEASARIKRDLFHEVCLTVDEPSRQISTINEEDESQLLATSQSSRSLLNIISQSSRPIINTLSQSASRLLNTSQLPITIDHRNERRRRRTREIIRKRERFVQKHMKKILIIIWTILIVLILHDFYKSYMLGK